MFASLAKSKVVVSGAAFGVSPSGFRRVHLEILPREVARLVGYDPRSLVQKPLKPGAKVARGTRDIPHNVSTQLVALQNQVQRSIDGPRVATMVQYLASAMESQSFADWGPIDLVTTSVPESTPEGVALDSDAEYFIADGQHRFCALLDFCRAYPHFADRFTQGVTLSVLPADKLVQWAGQEFHDRNYFSVPVRAGKALAVDSQSPINALAKSIATLPAVVTSGGIAYERDTLLTGDPRLLTHSTLHRFVRGFVFGRPGLDKGSDERADVDAIDKHNLMQYITALASVLPWAGEERDAYLTRASVVIAALAVVGHDMYGEGYSDEDRALFLRRLGAIDWHRHNLQLVGVVGSEKNGLVQPASSRPAIDATIRYLRERLGLLAPDKPKN
jgi:hypothetical protein